MYNDTLVNVVNACGNLEHLNSTLDSEQVWWFWGFGKELSDGTGNGGQKFSMKTKFLKHKPTESEREIKIYFTFLPHSGDLTLDQTCIFVMCNCCRYAECTSENIPAEAYAVTGELDKPACY